MIDGHTLRYNLCNVLTAEAVTDGTHLHTCGKLQTQNIGCLHKSKTVLIAEL